MSCTLLSTKTTFPRWFKCYKLKPYFFGIIANINDWGYIVINCHDTYIAINIKDYLFKSKYEFSLVADCLHTVVPTQAKHEDFLSQENYWATTPTMHCNVPTTSVCTCSSRTQINRAYSLLLTTSYIDLIKVEFGIKGRGNSTAKSKSQLLMAS